MTGRWQCRDRRRHDLTDLDGIQPKRLRERARLYDFFMAGGQSYAPN